MKKNTRIPIKLTALFLTVAMMLCMLPVSAVALEDDGMNVSLESTQSSSASPSQGESSAEETVCRFDISYWLENVLRRLS